MKRMTNEGKQVFTVIQFRHKSARGARAPRVLAIAPSRSRTFQSENISARRRNEHARARALPRQEGAFTLLELLVVIAIIAILLGLVFPVFQGVQDRAKKVQAKNDLTQIVTAVNAFYTEYGKYPLPASASGDGYATGGTTGTPSKAILDALRNLDPTLNPRQIPFISPAEDTTQASPKGKVGSDGQFHDPWGSAYRITIDADYDNQVPNPYTADTGAGPTNIQQGVITWSGGKDGKAPDNGGVTNFKNSDDVISWQ